MKSTARFEGYVEKSWEWVREVAADLSIPEEKAQRIIRVVLHALRAKISTQESFHLISQLPMIWKGIYVDGWKINEQKERMHGMEEYLDEIRKVDKQMAAYDFGNDQQARKMIFAVWKLLANHVSPQEITQICNCLPNEIANEIKSNIKMTII